MEKVIKNNWQIKNGELVTDLVNLTPNTMIILREDGKCVATDGVCRQWHRTGVAKCLTRYVAGLMALDAQEATRLLIQRQTKHPVLAFIRRAQYVVLVDRKGRVASNQIYDLRGKDGTIGSALKTPQVLVDALLMAELPLTDTRIWLNDKVDKMVRLVADDVLTQVRYCSIVDGVIKAINDAHKQQVIADLRAQSAAHTAQLREAAHKTA